MNRFQISYTRNNNEILLKCCNLINTFTLPIQEKNYNLFIKRTLIFYWIIPNQAYFWNKVLVNNCFGSNNWIKQLFAMHRCFGVAYDDETLKFRLMLWSGPNTWAQLDFSPLFYWVFKNWIKWEGFPHRLKSREG